MTGSRLAVLKELKESVLKTMEEAKYKRQMGLPIQAASKVERNMDLVVKNGSVLLCIPAIGLTIKYTAKGNTSGQMGALIKESGPITKLTAQASTPGLMAESTSAST